jgi:uncharacterized protein (TIGR00266 family)
MAVSGSVPNISGSSILRGGTGVVGRQTVADEIDFKIHGQEMQFVEVELDPGESAIAEAGAMMFKDACIHMDTVFGDGSKAPTGFFGKLATAGKRVLTGESLFMTVYEHQGQGKAHVSFAAPYPGTILAFKLSDIGGQLIAQKDAFLCAAKGVSIGIHFQKKIMTGLFGGAGFVLQKLEGDGYAFIHLGGTVIQRDLADGEELHVDTGCVACMTPGIEFDIVRAGSLKSMIFGGEGVFFAQLKGPGTVWIQSLPFSRLAGRMMASTAGAASVGGSNLWSGGSGGSLFGDSDSSSSSDD